MPLAGATAPVTLVGSVVQHAADASAALPLRRLAQPGSPSSGEARQAIFDIHPARPRWALSKRRCSTWPAPQVGKYLGLPTHAYLVAGDGRVVDAQAEMESGMSAVLGALAG